MAVANWFIENLKSVSPLKLQKLIYFAHGWNLALRDKPLIDELVEAWDYGPVIPSVYHEFKGFGDKPITELGTTFEMRKSTLNPLGKRIFLVTPKVPQTDEYTIKLLRKVVDVYGKYTGGQLSTMTHQPGTPWYITKQKYPDRKGVDIQDSEIKEYFSRKK